MKFLVLAACVAVSAASNLVTHPNGAVVPADEPAVALARAAHLSTKGFAYPYAFGGAYPYAFVELMLIPMPMELSPIPMEPMQLTPMPMDTPMPLLPMLTVLLSPLTSLLSLLPRLTTLLPMATPMPVSTLVCPMPV